MEHTPKPWKATFGINKNRIVRDSGGLICSLQKPSHYTGQDERYEKELEEYRANALLIAAAQDLLEACQRVLKWGGDRNFNPNCESGKMIREIERAIAKATK